MYLDVMTNQWIIVALGLGLVLVLIIFLAHIEGARPRPTESPEIRELGAGWLAALRSIPWVITLVTLASVVLGLMYYFYRVVYPPIW